MREGDGLKRICLTQPDIGGPRLLVEAWEKKVSDYLSERLEPFYVERFRNVPVPMGIGYSGFGLAQSAMCLRLGAEIEFLGKLAVELKD